MIILYNNYNSPNITLRSEYGLILFYVVSSQVSWPITYDMYKYIRANK